MIFLPAVLELHKQKPRIRAGSNAIFATQTQRIVDPPRAAKRGIGMRGPGEQEIETDRRIVRDKISLLKERLEKIAQQNETQRKNRGELIRVALVGYTNVEQSTLMNLLSKSEVLRKISYLQH